MTDSAAKIVIIFEARYFALTVDQIVIINYSSNYSQCKEITGNQPSQFSFIIWIKSWFKFGNIDTFLAEWYFWKSLCRTLLSLFR